VGVGVGVGVGGGGGYCGGGRVLLGRRERSWPGHGNLLCGLAVCVCDVCSCQRPYVVCTTGQCAVATTQVCCQSAAQTLTCAAGSCSNITHACNGHGMGQGRGLVCLGAHPTLRAVSRVCSARQGRPTGPPCLGPNAQQLWQPTLCCDVAGIHHVPSTLVGTCTPLLVAPWPQHPMQAARSLHGRVWLHNWWSGLLDSSLPTTVCSTCAWLQLHLRCTPWLVVWCCSGCGCPPGLQTAEEGCFWSMQGLQSWQAASHGCVVQAAGAPCHTGSCSPTNLMVGCAPGLWWCNCCVHCCFAQAA
jgi:hypothetical protein